MKPTIHRGKRGTSLQSSYNNNMDMEPTSQTFWVQALILQEYSTTGTEHVRLSRLDIETSADTIIEGTLAWIDILLISCSFRNDFYATLFYTIPPKIYNQLKHHPNATKR